MAVRRFLHVGLSVTDLERSARFYCLALGFQQSRGPFTVPSTQARLFGLETLDARVRFYARDDLRIEMLEFTDPAPRIEGGLIPFWRQGLVHFNFKVDDVDETAVLVEKHGGRLYPGTRVTEVAQGHQVDLLMCSDPDGTPIELSRDFGPSDVGFEPYQG